MGQSNTEPLVLPDTLRRNYEQLVCGTAMDLRMTIPCDANELNADHLPALIQFCDGYNAHMGEILRMAEESEPGCSWSDEIPGAQQFRMSLVKGAQRLLKWAEWEKAMRE